MKFTWGCTDCGAAGSVDNPGLPVTSLVNLCSFQHIRISPDCKTAKAADVQLKPGGCMFSPEKSAA
jgi:hypothetical protein